MDSLHARRSYHCIYFSSALTFRMVYLLFFLFILSISMGGLWKLLHFTWPFKKLSNDLTQVALRILYHSVSRNPSTPKLPIPTDHFKNSPRADFLPPIRSFKQWPVYIFYKIKMKVEKKNQLICNWNSANFFFFFVNKDVLLSEVRWEQLAMMNKNERKKKKS